MCNPVTLMATAASAASPVRGGMQKVQPAQAHRRIRHGLAALVTGIAVSFGIPGYVSAADPANDAWVEQLVRGVRAEVPKTFSLPREISVSLTFLARGDAPPSAACPTSIRADLDVQLGKLSSATGRRFRLVTSPADAMINIVVGDTVELLQKRSGEVPVDEWQETVKARSPVPVEATYMNLGFPHFFATEFAKGVYREADGAPVYGQLLIHWIATGNRRRSPDGACSYLFTWALVTLLSDGVRTLEPFATAEAPAKRPGSMSVLRHLDDQVSASLLCMAVRGESAPASDVAKCAVKVVGLMNEYK
ncbi:MAG: hypothetical protein AAB403_02730 [Planctomycetota bacterium]